jgi:hypothetical protein
MSFCFRLKNPHNFVFQFAIKTPKNDDAVHCYPSAFPLFGGITICINREFDSNEIDESARQYEKHDETRISTLLEITIDSSDDCENASDSIRINRKFDSNEIDENDSHSRKHDKPRISTLLGIKFDSSDDLENASDLIRINRKFDSNEIDESARQYEKHDEPRISTLFGITID